MRLTEILGMLFVSACIAGASIMAHELAHALVCILTNSQLLGFKALFIRFDGRRLSFGFNGKNHCAFQTNDKRIMKCIVAAGPISELIIAAICLVASTRLDARWIKYGLLIDFVWIIVTTTVDLHPKANGDGKLLFTKGE